MKTKLGELYSSSSGSSKTTVDDTFSFVYPNLFCSEDSNVLITADSEAFLFIAFPFLATLIPGTLPFLITPLLFFANFSISLLRFFSLSLRQDSGKSHGDTLDFRRCSWGLSPLIIWCQTRIAG
ncbi:hypothetical protein MN608_09141 [Microdochium nivale]|nr:hypothetical protein MN608_09141 [Microdochium nivale]